MSLTQRTTNAEPAKLFPRTGIPIVALAAALLSCTCRTDAIRYGTTRS